MCLTTSLLRILTFVLAHLITISSSYITFSTHVLGTYHMALSKPLETLSSTTTRNIDNYDFPNDWDTCDYIDPTQLPINVNKHDLLILQWNTRGLRGKHDAVVNLLNNILEQKVDIVMINETWLNNKSPPLPPIAGNKFVGKPRSDRKGGGVGFLIRNDIIYRRKENLEVETKTLENIVIGVKSKPNLLLCSGYRPPNTDIGEFLVSYEKILTTLKAHKHNEYVIGIDHNLDFIKHHIHKPTKTFIELNTDNNMLPTITRPTRITKTSATLINNLFISQHLQTNFKSGILLDDTSNHMPCYLILPDTTNHIKTLKEIQHRNLSEKNKKKICECIKTVDWTVRLWSQDTDSAFNDFHNYLTSTIDKIAPVMTKKINP